MKKRIGSDLNPNIFDTPNIYRIGQQILYSKLNNFNKLMAEPNNTIDQRFLPGVGNSGNGDDINSDDEGSRLFKVDNNNL